MLHDIRLACRSLGRYPGFSALAILIVALGAGANAAVFSVVRAVLVEPLPFSKPDELVAIRPSSFVSNADLDFLRARTRSFDALAAASPGWTTSLLGAGEPRRVVATKTSANLFATLGVPPALGRTFHADEDRPGAHRVAVLSHALWVSAFGGDPAAVGRVVTIEGEPHEIVGVMGTGFEFIGREADLWMPLAFDPGGRFWRGGITQAIGRVRPGVTVESAAEELRALLPAWQAALGYERDWGQGAMLATLRDAIVGDVRRPLLVLIGAVGLVVLLTAANLGTLLLGKHVARRREMAVRGALGASAWRIVRATAAESLVLAAAGAAAGTLAAYLALPALVRLLPPDVPRLAAIAVDPLVLAAVLASAVVSVLAFGALPSLLAVRPSLQPLLRLGAQSDTLAGRRTLHVLVVGQVALAIVLGFGAALMVRSLIGLQLVDPGFDADRVLTLRLQPGAARYSPIDRAVAYQEAMIEAVSNVPGVTAVAAVNHLPLSGYNWVMPVEFDEHPLPPGVSPPTVGWRMITGRYFETMGIPLLAGRAFEARDRRAAPAVTIVNEAFARRFFGGVAAALGRSVRTRGLGTPGSEEAYQIVGVVGSVRHVTLASDAAPEMYRPYAQTYAVSPALVVRTSGAPGSIAAAVRQAVWAVDAAVPIGDLMPLATLLRDSLGRPRLIATLLLVFAGAALAIVVCGVYGVVAYSVRRRERELGIRLALGAEPRAVSKLVLRQGLFYAGAGLALGLPLALAAAGVLRGLLYGVEPRDPATVVSLGALIALTTVAATVLPARRAQRVDPAAVLKAE